MEKTLQEDFQTLENANETLKILVHTDSYAFDGEWHISPQAAPGSLANLGGNPLLFNYLIAYHDTNHLIHPDDIGLVSDILSHLDPDSVVNFYFKVIAPSGEVKLFTGTGTLTSINERPVSEIKTHRTWHETAEANDLSETKPAPHAGSPASSKFPIRQDNLLQSILKASSIGMGLLKAVRDNAHTIVDFEFNLVNKAMEQQMGYAHLTGMKYSQLPSQLLSEISLQQLIDVSSGSKSLKQELLLAEAHKSRWVNVVIAKFDKGIMMMAEDITSRKQSEEQVRHQTVLFTKVIESSPDIIQIVNAESGKSAYINKMLLEELGYPFEEIKKIELENGTKALIHPDDVSDYDLFIQQINAAHDQDTVETELRWQAHNGKWRWYKTRARVFERDQAGTLLKFLAFSQDITAQKSAEEEKRKHKLLRELENARTAFFSNVSHEFRTPLTLLLAPLQEIIQETNLSKRDKDKAQLAYRNALRLQKLVNTLLDFSRIESSKVNTVFQPTDLAELTKNLASNFRTLIEHAGLEFSVQCADLEEPVYINRQMYEKIIFNLISNAFKFTLRGKIEVVLREKKNKVQLIVSDTGIGIAKDQLPRIFHRFMRIEGGPARTYEGSGIGLSLVRELVNIHHGRIKVVSRPGEGTSFTISFRKGTGHLSPKSISGASPYAENEELTRTFVEEAKGWSTGVPEVAGSNNAQGAKKQTQTSEMHPLVLVVEDNVDMREYLQSLLSKQYAVALAPNGRVAIDNIDPDRLPDLILCDIMMPELDGYGVLHAIKSNTLTREIPVILLSAKAGEESKVEGLNAGADDYLVKPFSAKEVLARIDARIEIARARNKTKQVWIDINKQLEEKVDERTKALAQSNSTLRRMNAELEISNADLSTFAFIASHDLSEPLRKIQIYTNLILQRDAASLSPQAQEMFTKIVSAIQRMKALIGDILAYSRVHSEVPTEPVDLNKLLDLVTSDLSVVIEETGATVAYGKLPTMRGNPFQLSQLFQNLLSNSIKFQQPGVPPHVTISASMEKGRLIDHAMALPDETYLKIAIKDNGIGFQQSYSEKIFEMFQRLHGLSEYPGTGMGLAICKKIVTNHGGFISAQGTPGQGAIFNCYFPSELVEA